MDRETAPRPAPSTPTDGLDLIGFLIAESTGVSVSLMKSPQKRKRLFLARRLFSKMAYSQGFTQEEIGRWMNKDRTSIANQLKHEEAEE